MKGFLWICGFILSIVLIVLGFNEHGKDKKIFITGIIKEVKVDVKNSEYIGKLPYKDVFIDCNLTFEEYANFNINKNLYYNREISVSELYKNYNVLADGFTVDSLRNDGLALVYLLFGFLLLIILLIIVAGGDGLDLLALPVLIVSSLCE